MEAGLGQGDRHRSVDRHGRDQGGRPVLGAAPDQIHQLEHRPGRRLAIGGPFGRPETVTSGIVSQTGRSITALNNFTISAAIQTDTPINPGNSGGPLLNADGEVLGLNDQIETNNTIVSGQGSSSGIGFATPSNSVVKVANEIIASKKVQHAYLGTSLNPASVGDAQIATSGSSSCPQVITPNSPAAAAGLEAGDKTTALDGKPITSTDQFIADLNNYSPGQTITLTIQRRGDTKKVRSSSATARSRPARASCPAPHPLGGRRRDAPGAEQIA